jgi:osmotically-inducible protein OsmY
LVVLDEQGAATLTGQVNSAETMRLAAIMVRLEPGVRSIKNELIVGESPTGQ